MTSLSKQSKKILIFSLILISLLIIATISMFIIMAKDGTGTEQEVLYLSYWQL
jgi:hypothetical protein